MWDCRGGDCEQRWVGGREGERRGGERDPRVTVRCEILRSDRGEGRFRRGGRGDQVVVERGGVAAGDDQEESAGIRVLGKKQRFGVCGQCDGRDGVVESLVLAFGRSSEDVQVHLPVPASGGEEVRRVVGFVPQGEFDDVFLVVAPLVEGFAVLVVVEDYLPGHAGRDGLQARGAEAETGEDRRVLDVGERVDDGEGVVGGEHVEAAVGGGGEKELNVFRLAGRGGLCEGVDGDVEEVCGGGESGDDGGLGWGCEDMNGCSFNRDKM